MTVVTKRQARLRRRRRVRARIVGNAERPRLSVYRSNRGIFAQLKGKNLELALGYSHPVQLEAPEGIDFEVPQPTEVIVRGIDKQQVGQVAADIRKRRPPEPYKGKGIRYRDEHVMRKVGKRA